MPIVRISGRKRKSVSKKLSLMLLPLKLSLPRQQIHQMMASYYVLQLIAVLVHTRRLRQVALNYRFNITES